MASAVSRSVRDHVHGRLDLAFDSLGALDLKNISRPVEAFVLRTADTPTPVEQTLVQRISDPLPLPGKPSIAVLAFTNMSGDPEQEYFSDGIADDIITELSRSHSLFVIARNSSFTYRGQSIDIKQAAANWVCAMCWKAACAAAARRFASARGWLTQKLAITSGPSAMIARSKTSLRSRMRSRPRW